MMGTGSASSTSHASVSPNPNDKAMRTLRAVVAALVALAIGGGSLLATGCSGTSGDADGTANTPATAETSGTDGTAEKGSDEGTGADGADDGTALSVDVAVDSSAADGSVEFSGTVELPAGATAYDALVATGLELKASESQYGMYVESVGGLATGDHGEMSGWTYEVNGEMAMVACDAYELAEGDSVSWTYTTGD